MLLAKPDFLTNIADWPAVVDEVSKAFAPAVPTSTLVEVKGLINPDMLVEIEVDAIVGGDGLIAAAHRSNSRSSAFCGSSGIIRQTVKGRLTDRGSVFLPIRSELC